MPIDRQCDKGQLHADLQAESGEGPNRARDVLHGMVWCAWTQKASRRSISRLKRWLAAASGSHLV